MYPSATTLYNNFSALRSYVLVRNGMLVFNNEEAFKKVITCLHQSINALPNPCNLGVDKADYVLEQFERLFDYRSLRQYVAMKVNGLLLTNNLTADNNPDDFYFPDKVIRSIINVNLEVAIGGKVLCLNTIQANYLRLRRGEKVDESFLTEKIFDDENMSRFGLRNTQQVAYSIAAGGTIVVSGIFNLSIGSNPLNRNFRVSFVDVTEGCISDQPLRYNWKIYKITNTGSSLIHQEDGVGDNINYLFSEAGWYEVCVQAYNDRCKSEYKCTRYYISGEPIPPPPPSCCKPYALQEKTVSYTSKKQVRTRLLLMTFQPVLPYTSITAATRTWKKGPLGLVWWPHKVSFISVKLSGTYNELWCNGPYKVIPGGYVDSGTNRSQASLVYYSFAPIFVHANSVVSNHSFSDPSPTYLDLSICKP